MSKTGQKSAVIESIINKVRGRIYSRESGLVELMARGLARSPYHALNNLYFLMELNLEPKVVQGSLTKEEPTNEKVLETYVVVWHYMANHGFDIVEDTSVENALKNHHYYRRTDIRLFAFPRASAEIKK